MRTAADEGARQDDLADALPEWLWEELIALAGDFDHLPEEARYGAVVRNLSGWATDYFESLVARTVGGQAADGGF